MYSNFRGKFKGNLNKAFLTDKCRPHEIKFKHCILKRVVLTSITVGILFNVTNFGLKSWL